MKNPLRRLAVACCFIVFVFAACSQHKAPSITTVDKDGLSALMESEPDLILLDVRTAEETANGMIPGAINFDWRDQAAFSENIQKLDKHTPIAVYCMSGTRSGQASAYLLENGFTSIYDFSGGYMSWSE